MKEGLTPIEHYREWVTEADVKRRASLSFAQLQRLAEEFSASNPAWVKEETVVSKAGNTTKKRSYSSELVRLMESRKNETPPPHWQKKEDFGSVFTGFMDNLALTDERRNYFAGKTLFTYYSPGLIVRAKSIVDRVRTNIIEKIEEAGSMTVSDFYRKLTDGTPQLAKGWSGLQRLLEDTSMLSSEQVRGRAKILMRDLVDGSIADSNRRKRRAGFTQGFVDEIRAAEFDDDA